MKRLLSLLLIVVMVVTPFSRALASAGPPSLPAESLTRLPGHRPAALALATEIATPLKAAQDATIQLTITLRRADQQGFDRYLADVYDPQSAGFRHFLTQPELNARFGPTAESYARIRDYMVRHGFTLTQGSENRLTLSFEGTRAQAEDAFAIGIRNYERDGRKFYANDNDPALPGDIAGDIVGISGLSDFAVRRAPGDKEAPKTDCGLGPNGVSLVLGLAGSITGFEHGLAGGLLGALVGALMYPVYCLGVILGAATVKGEALDSYWICLEYAANPDACIKPDPPSTQKIGLLEFDTFHQSDVANWLALLKVDQDIVNRLSQVHINGGVASPGAGESEVLLDINAMLMTTMFTTTQYVVYDAPANTSFEQLFNAMINDGMTVISNSWSQCESQTSLAEAQSIDTVLAQAAAAGISVFNGTGDSGSTCLDGSPNTIGVPADSPHATAVGGTSYTPGPGLTYGSESWWNSGAGQGGFGVSQYFTRPSYQNGLNASAMRSVPDITLNADPRNGVTICQASRGGCPTGLLYGGTSLAAPLMAGEAALLNTALGFNIGNANAAFYPLGGTLAFHSAASMGSDFAHVGLGTPSLDYLQLALSQQTIGPVDAVASRAFGTPQVSADGNSKAIVQVNLIDSQGYPISGKSISLAQSNGGHAVISPAGAISNVYNGAAVFEITDSTIENLTFTATDTTDNVQLVQTVPVSFVSPPATNGNVLASPNSVLANGSATSTITVTLLNANSQGARNKVVTLSQQGGHSIVTGPTPAVTDVNGQVQFTVSDGFAETVTYTAIDVTDGNLPVPGSTQVTFTGGSTSCSASVTPPAAAAGFALGTFASGFPAANFFYGGVNWGGCNGASNPAFDTAANVIVSDFYTGALYKFSAAGGAVPSTAILGNVGQTVQQPVFGLDGSLYVSRGSTGSGFTSGNILRVSPSTGAVLATVATGLTCPSGLAVDPLSGDLFFTDTCSGGGSDNASLWRIQGPASATPTTVVYATLSSTPNTPVSFAPDGTIYGVTGYSGAGAVVRIDGTNRPQPAAVTVLSGISSDFPPTIGQTTANGAAKSLIVHSGGQLKLVDITTVPFTTTVMATGTISTGTIGIDGCLYAGTNNVIYRLTSANGTCGFKPTNPSPALVLSPGQPTPDPAQGTTLAMTASFANISVPQGTAVTFAVVGANTAVVMARTDANGSASASYPGIFSGRDYVVASAIVNGTNLGSNVATVNWAAGMHSTLLDINANRSIAKLGQSVPLQATLYDQSLAPRTPLAGQTVRLAIGAQFCDTITNAGGIATCSVIPSSVNGLFALTASFAGAGTYLPTSSTRDILISSAPTLDIDLDGNYDALTDGLLFMRALFGLSGPALTANALGQNALRTDPAVIAAYIAGLGSAADIDGNGVIDALTDGLLVIRYLSGLHGDALISGAIGPNAQRNASQIESHIQSLMP